MSHHPNQQARQVHRVDELAQRLAGAVHDEFALVEGPLVVDGRDAFVHARDHAGNDVAAAHREVVVRPEDVTRHDRCEHVAVALVVGPIRDVDQALGVAVAEIRRMRWPVMDLGGEEMRNGNIK